MPKRVKTSLVQKSKKSRRSASDSSSKRNSIPRSCKNTTVSNKGIVDFDFLTIPNNKYDMESNQAKQNEKNKDSRRGKDDSVSMSEDELDVVFDVQEEKKKKIYEVITVTSDDETPNQITYKRIHADDRKDNSVSTSEDELDVVFDVQEEKKKKIYEVITVTSDDETPNQITYERVYADDPEKRVVDESEIKELLSKTLPPTKTNLNEDIVGDIVKEANLIKENASNTKKSEKSTEIIKLDDRVMTINTDTKGDNDNEIICVCVLDPKTKVEQKRASVEEICLSSDSEPEIMPKISPINCYRSMNESENSYGSCNNQITYERIHADDRKDNSVSTSEDELDVVFDVQEEKKKKIYEVITVTSDDETPNQITYERVYADDPEKRVVDESEIKELLSKTLPPTKTNLNEDIVGDIVKEANLIKENASNTKKSEKSTEIIKLDDRVMTINTDTKGDNDNEIICVCVLDPKTKVEQKRASVEEICLSSDSEPEIMPEISPINCYRSMNESENSYGSYNSNFGSNNSHFSLGFNWPAGMYSYVYPSKSDEASHWDSNSTRSKPSTVQDSSPAPSESPKALGGDDSSSSSSTVRFLSDSSQHHQNLSPRSDSSNNENPSSPTPSSDDEERDIYWKDSPAPSESSKALGGHDSSSLSSSMRFFSDSNQHHQNLSPRSDSSNNEDPYSPTPSSDDEERDIYSKGTGQFKANPGMERNP